MTENNRDYVYPDPVKQVKIIIPGMYGLVKVVPKDALTLKHMHEYETEEFKPAKALINFFVQTTKKPIEPVTEFRPPMILEARGEDYDLGYLDLDKKKWKRFKTQSKENGTAWVKIKYWADDPQVAWGY